jgi:hypothetical protein
MAPGVRAFSTRGYLVVLSPSEMTVMLSQNLKYLVPVSVLREERNDLLERQTRSAPVYVPVV